LAANLGVWMLCDAMRQRGTRLQRVDAWFGESSGGFRGGSFASVLEVLDEAQRDPSVQPLLADPYALDPAPRGGPDGPDPVGIAWEPRLGCRTAPFVMAAINTRVVRRSNAVASEGCRESADGIRSRAGGTHPPPMSSTDGLWRFAWRRTGGLRITAPGVRLAPVGVPASAADSRQPS